MNLIDNAGNVWEYKIPSDIAERVQMSDNLKGIKWLDNGIEYRISNPKGGNFPYLDGYFRIQRILNGQPQAMNKLGEWVSDANDAVGQANRVYTHFHIKGFK